MANEINIIEVEQTLLYEIPENQNNIKINFEGLLLHDQFLAP